MIMRVINFGRFAALLLFGLGFSAVPAAAQCGGCYAPVVVYQSSCSCCGCGGSAYYGGYGYGGGYGGGGYYAAAYGYSPYAYGYVDVAPRVYAPRVYGPRLYPRVYGPRLYPRVYGPRFVGARYWAPRRVIARRY